MKKIIFSITACLWAAFGFTQNNQQWATQKYSFIENKGQFVDENKQPCDNILFATQIGSAKAFLTKTGISYQWQRTINAPTANAKTESEKFREEVKQAIIESYRIDIDLVGANPNPVIEKFDAADDYVNYYLAQCPQGILGVKHYAKVVYKDVYPGIDWVWYNKNGQVKYDFVVHPGADYKQIKLKISGAENINIAENGGLEINTSFGQVKENAPLTFQGGNQIASMFHLSENTVSFHIAPTNITEDIIIDPIIILWSTYYGGDMDDISNEMATGLINDNVYIAGSTSSSFNIFYGGFSNTISGQSGEAFLAKFDENGKRLWATYYGGVGIDVATGVAVDSADNIYMTGNTFSSDSLAYNGFQNTSAGNTDALLVKFSPAGLRIWATYYGGSGTDNSLGVCASLKNVYITGVTNSTSGIATTGSYKSNQDTYIAQFDTSGNRVSGVYYGGTGYDGPMCIHMDISNNVYIAGQTYSSSSIYYKGHLSTFQGNGDAFLAKFSPSLTLLWSTYYGGSQLEYGMAVATDSLNNVFLAGQTSSTNGVALSSGYQTFLNGPEDGFLVKFNPNGTRIWGTYFGGENMDNCAGVSVNSLNDVYITGKTYSKTGIEYNGVNKTLKGNTDIYIAKFNNSGNRIWATYFGDTLVDQSNAIACDNKDAIYITGYVKSIKNIAVDGHQNTQGGGQDAFLTKFFDKDLSIAGFPNDVYCGEINLNFILKNPLENFFKAHWYHDTTAGWYYEGDTLDITITQSDTSWVRWESPRGNGTWQKEITTVLASPIANFTVDDSIKCWLGNNFIFTNTTDTAGFDASFTWYFGDNSNGYDFSPTHHYAFPGVYSVQLVARSTLNNCNSSFSKIVKIFSEPIPHLTGNQHPLQNTIETYSTDPLNGVTYTWSVIGGSIVAGTGTNTISVLWGSGADGEVGVVITDKNGCKNLNSVLQFHLVFNAIQSIKSPKISVYPVPANGNTLWINTEERSSYKIIDMLGKTVTQGNLEGANNETADITGVKQGTYILRIFSDNGQTYNLKLIVN